MHDFIFKLNNKGIVKVNCIYKYSSKLFIIYDNIENNLLKEEKLDINIKYRKEIIENLFNIIKKYISLSLGFIFVFNLCFCQSELDIFVRVN